MALSRSAGLCRLALRTQFAVVRLLATVGGGGEAPSVEATRRRVDLAAPRPDPALRPLSDLAQPEPPRKVISNAKPAYEQVQLNKVIRDSVSVDEILDLVTMRSALLNCVSVSAALSVIAKLIGKREPALWLKSDARFRQLMRATLSMIESGTMDAQGFSNTLYACGQLGVVPPPSWMRVYWATSALNLGEFAPQALSNTMYACSQLGVVPPADWLQRFWDVSALKLPECIPQNLSNTLYACGQLGITPPSAWLQSYWDASAFTLGEFVPQALSNTLYACSQLGITPPADWMLRYWHASALKFGEFIPQDLSNTLYACGQLRMAPPADWLLRFWHASATKLGGFVPQAYSNTLNACSQLGIAPSADWLQVFSHECVRVLPDMNQQDLANIALALATLAVWETPLWPGLWQRICHSLSRDIAGWSTEDRLNAMQVYQAYKAAAVERPGLLPALSPELLAAASKSWIDGLDTDTAKTSKLHGDISASLTRMGVAHVNEHWCERTERSIDISIEGVAPVAVEVDGPHHFLQDGGQNGSTALRNRMLAAHGWRVVVVDYRVWQQQLTSEAQREQYLRCLLA